MAVSTGVGPQTSSQRNGEVDAARVLATAAPSIGAPLAFPLGCTVALASLALLDRVRLQPTLFWSIAGAAAGLLLWTVALLVVARRGGRTLILETALRRQHYLQACAQGTVLLYWGYYWRPVYEAAPLLLAQLLFAYAFDALLSWSRRDTHSLGFGIFPVVFSINLFLWFRPEWFYFQFVMVAIGLAAKEFIRWNKEGRSAHIFNPSSFPLALFSLALLATDRTHLTMGQEIATTQFYPPHIYLMLFLIGLPGQFFFGVTSMTMSAVVSVYVWGLLYYAATGVYFFYDSYIPIAVFLGMHLLFTDPSTSPRTELGRIIFGVLYGLSTVALYSLLTRAGLPAFYDKLLQVPVLNLSIGLIDRAARSRALRSWDPGRLGGWLGPRQRHVAYMSVWACAFALIGWAGGVGDDHPGQWLPFWQQSCQRGSRSACSYLEVLQANYCNQGSGWACNELAVQRSLRAADDGSTGESLERGCALGFAAACRNLDGRGGVSLERADPSRPDYPIILRGSKGPIGERPEGELRALACRQGWPRTCEGAQAGDGPG